MKRFSSYITELFDKAHAWRNWQSGGLHWMYQFAFAKVRGGEDGSMPNADGRD